MGDTTPTLAEATRAGVVRAPAGFPERYEFLGLIGAGGMGEVVQVRDRLLDQVLAMKLLRTGLIDSPTARARFSNEARITARLQHPAIVSVHDSGTLPDGRPWFTMKEVRGHTLRREISKRHGPSSAKQDTNNSGLKRLLDTFARACQALGYAHTQGIVHRDLKPANIMIGAFGEVQIVDWGIAIDTRAASANSTQIPGPSDTVKNTDIGGAHKLTQEGQVIGTPAYMAPEQAEGRMAQFGPPTDVFALGAILYEILSGRGPNSKQGREHLLSIGHGQTPAAMAPLDPSIDAPEELYAICTRALAYHPRERHPNAALLATGIFDWLDGAGRVERALALIDEAAEFLTARDNNREQCQELRDQAAVLLKHVQPSDPIDKKRPAWQLEEKADSSAREAAINEANYERKLHAALNITPHLQVIHERLADLYQERMQGAETQRDMDAAAQNEVMLRAHDRGKYAAWLAGIASLSLVTDPPGAQVGLHRFEHEDRRLTPRYLHDLGKTPLHTVSIRHGSYLLTIKAPGRATVLYPIAVGRGEHWLGARPGATEPHPIYLPRSTELGPDELYIPAGWFMSGGDPEAADGLPRRRLWVDAFVIKRFAVTHSDYLDFINSTHQPGDFDSARRHMPTMRANSAGGQRIPLYQDTGSGSLSLGVGGDGEALQLDWPVTEVDNIGARAYATWLGNKDDKDWRLPHAIEWEKSVRGVDGRFWPWGDHFDASWACTVLSHSGKPYIQPVSAFATDESLYGVRGACGNVRNLCANAWSRDGDLHKNDLLPIEAGRDQGDEAINYYEVRGGSWTSAPHLCRPATRLVMKPGARRSAVGFRVCRSIGGPMAS